MTVRLFMGGTSYVIGGASDGDLDAVADLVARCIRNGGVITYSTDEKARKVVSFADVRDAEVSLYEPQFGDGYTIPLAVLSEAATLPVP